MRKETLPMPADVAELATKSARIRALRDLGWKIGDIGRTVGVSYQFAHNVCGRPLKRLIKEQREAERARRAKAHQNEQEQGDNDG